MSPDAIPLLDAEGAAAGDQAAVDAGDSWAALMERASGHLARGVVALAGRGYGLRVTILAGKGNNGGDGWAAARRLRARGAEVHVVAADGLDVEMSDEAADHRRRWLDLGGRVSDGVAGVGAALAWCDVAVDALLGTGVSGAPRDAAGAAADALLRARDRDGLPVVACDVPSGVSVDDGTAPDGAVRADLTVTFGGHKRGLLLHPGAGHAGRVIVGDLGPRYAPPPPDWWALTAAGAAPPSLQPDDDKRARGVVLVVAGSRATAGAAALAGRAALRAGAGLVTVATPSVAQPVVAGFDPAIMTMPLPHDDGEVAPRAAETLGDVGEFDVVVCGPGLGHGDGARAVTERLLSEARALVLDADGLNVFRDDPARLGEHAGTLVLTPHQRELARIGGGRDGDDAWGRRTARVPELAARYDAVLVAKGPGSMVAAPDGRVWVTPTGGPELGTGGTGDALTGLVAAAVAREDVDAPTATARAVWRHGWCGDTGGRRVGGLLTSSDLVEAIPSLYASLRDHAARTPAALR